MLKLYQIKYDQAEEMIQVQPYIITDPRCEIADPLLYIFREDEAVFEYKENKWQKIDGKERYERGIKSINDF